MCHSTRIVSKFKWWTRKETEFQPAGKLYYETETFDPLRGVCVCVNPWNIGNGTTPCCHAVFMYVTWFFYLALVLAFKLRLAFLLYMRKFRSTAGGHGSIHQSVANEATDVWRGYAVWSTARTCYRWVQVLQESWLGTDVKRWRGPRVVRFLLSTLLGTCLMCCLLSDCGRPGSTVFQLIKVNVIQPKFRGRSLVWRLTLLHLAELFDVCLFASCWTVWCLTDRMSISSTSSSCEWPTSPRRDFIISGYGLTISILTHQCVLFLFLALYPAASASAASAAHLSHTSLSTTICHTHLCQPPSFTHTTLPNTIFHTHFCHTPSLSHIFVNHHLSHTTLSTTIFHTPLSTTIFVTHLCQPPSVTHNFVNHHLSHASLSHIFVNHHLSHTSLSTICHTQLCQPPSFTHLCQPPSLSHIFVNHHLSHTTLSTTIFHTQLCQPPSFTHIFVTHHLEHHLSHASLSHTFVKHHLCHTPSVTHASVTHLCQPPFVTHHVSHTSLSHTIFHTHSSRSWSRTLAPVGGVAATKGAQISCAQGSLQDGAPRRGVPAKEQSFHPGLGSHCSDRGHLAQTGVHPILIPAHASTHGIGGLISHPMILPSFTMP